MLSYTGEQAVEIARQKNISASAQCIDVTHWCTQPTFACVIAVNMAAYRHSMRDGFGFDCLVRYLAPQLLLHCP